MSTPLRNDEETRDWLRGLLRSLAFWDALDEEDYARMFRDSPDNGVALNGEHIVWLVGWDNVRALTFKTRESVETFLRLLRQET